MTSKLAKIELNRVTEDWLEDCLENAAATKRENLVSGLQRGPMGITKSGKYIYNYSFIVFCFN